MEKKKWMILASILLMFLMVQLTFFWLAPKDRVSYWVVYVCLSVLSIGSLVADYLLIIQQEFRRIAGVLLVSNSIWLLGLLAGALLLVVNASVRTAIFSQLIIMCLYGAGLVLLLWVSLRQEIHSVSSEDIHFENSYSDLRAESRKPRPVQK